MRACVHVHACVCACVHVCMCACVLMQYRVIVFAKTWMSKFPVDFRDADTLAKLDEFQKQILAFGHRFNLRSVLEKLDARGQRLRGALQTPAENANRFSLYQSHEIAQQLALLNWSVSNLVNPREYLNQSWKRDETGANLKAWIQFNSQTALWVAMEIVRVAESTRTRAAIVEKWIDIAENCKAVNNFNGCYCIIKGLGNSNIARLTETWKEVTQASKLRLQNLRNFVKEDNDFKDYRNVLFAASAPCIPILEVFLEEVTFVDMSTPNTLNNQIINFAKYRTLGRLIRKLEDKLQTQYKFADCEPLRLTIAGGIQTSNEATIKEKSFQVQQPNFFLA
jgi:hypothetical protein